MLLIISSVAFVLVSIVLVILILVQNDKGGGLSGSIGGGLSNANSVMGAQNTENILNKGTVIFAILYFLLTIGISLGVSRVESGKAAGSGIQKVLNEGSESAPVE
jgi:preprotein translocase subunit SecG